MNRIVGYFCLLIMGILFPGLLVVGGCAGTAIPRIGVTVNPLCVALSPGGSAQFNATIFIDEVVQAPNPDNAGVTWSVLGGDVNGSISNAAGTEGFYVAPNTQPPPADEVGIIATSKEDDQKQGQATVILNGPCPTVPPTPVP